MTTQLPAPQYPTVTHVVSLPLYAEAKTENRQLGCPNCQAQLEVPVRVYSKPEPVTWAIGQLHPLVPKMKVVRMFVGEDSVEIYSLSEDGAHGVRNSIPLSAVKLVQEAMPLDVFVSELEDAEAGDEEGVPAEEGDEEVDEEADEASADLPQAPPASANGQAVV